MSLTLRYSEEYWVAIITLLSAWLIASSYVTVGDLGGLATLYVYWAARIAIEATLFIAILHSCEKVANEHMKDIRCLWVYAFAIFISLLPFTLAITSVDLILGFPELGLHEANATVSRLQALGLEILYLLDNHIALCLLLLLPRLLLTKDPSPTAKTAEESQHKPLFFEAATPPLEGHIYHIEAQQHYIRVVTTNENRMVLYRFSDAIREMPDTLGMQVHRSHWVAYSTVKGLLKEGKSLKLMLTNDTTVPVSRSFRAHVEEKFS